MPTVSDVVATKTALVTLLDARAGLDAVEVAYAWKEGLKPESICLGNPESIDHEPASMKAGRVHRNEKYLLPVYIAVYKDGGTIQEVETRAAAIAGEVESAVADAKTVGGNLWATVEDIKLDSGYTLERGAAAGITVRLNVFARLT